VKQQDPWLTSYNTAALIRYAHSNIAEAELSATKENGGFTNFNKPSDAFQLNTGIESFYRISHRTVLTGHISYQSYDGKDMAGSAFIPHSTPSNFRPFDIVEDSLTNAGEKHLDTYYLGGAIGSSITDYLAIGAKIDYTAANYAKYKDLRHQNKLMDFLAIASIYARPNTWSSIGAHYCYHRNTESIDFGTYGTTDKIYKSLIDYGGFFGKVEQFGSTGYTDKSREMPLVDEQNGSGVEVEIRPVSWFAAFGSATFSHRKGYYGRKSPYTITYTNHSSNLTELNSRLSLFFNQSSHYLDFTYSTEDLNNKAETYRELKNATGASYYEYYDPVETADKELQQGSITYTGNLLVNGELPIWNIVAGFSWMSRKQTAYLYPFYRYQKLSTQNYFVSLTRNIIQQHGIWSLTLSGNYQEGSGKPCIDGTFTAPSAKQENPPTMEAYLMREHQYLTSPQYGVGAQVKYAFLLHGTQLKLHTRIAFNHFHATKTNEYSNGNDHTMVTAAVGCTF
jgi:hypothetical protein